MKIELDNSIKDDSIVDSNLLVLNKTSVQVSIQGVSAQTIINQYFENTQEQNIEAVYTFPLPINAVILDILVVLDNKIVRGQIQKKEEAIEKYEDAIESGDMAILLEKVEDGLYTLNMGNLLPEQKAKVTLVYSQVLSWQDEELRYTLPTVIAPKYGYCPLQAQQQPDYDFRAEYPLEFSLNIKGQFSSCSVSSPSHEIKNKVTQDNQNIQLSQSAFLDRELIILLEKKLAASSFAVTQKMKTDDGIECAVIASIQATFNQESSHNIVNNKQSPQVINFLLDCSGSMGGDSIELAIKALLLALDELSEEDYFSITCFGSTTQQLTKGIVPASKAYRVLARRQLRHTNADLGGTEIFNALDEVLSFTNPTSYTKNCFLITDGEVWDNGELKEIAQQFNKQQHRIFTVGIGSAVSEKLVTILASESMGASEFVSPNEEMVNKIHRHFKRLFMPVLNEIYIDWGAEVLWQSVPDFLYVGDSVTLYAQLKNKPQTDVTIKAGIKGEVLYQQSIIGELSQNTEQDVIRQVANTQLKAMKNKSKRAELAVEYQLMDETTAFIMVEENEVTGDQGLPVFHKISQMMAAGWAGQGALINEPSAKYMDVPAFLRISNDSRPMFSKGAVTRYNSLDIEEIYLSDFINVFKNSYQKNHIDFAQITINQLLELGLSDKIAEDLSEVITETKTDEHKILLYFIFLLSGIHLGISSIFFKYKIKTQVKTINLSKVVKEIVTDISGGF